MKPNTSNNDNIKDMILKAYPDYPDLSCAELWELMDKCLKQGYAKVLDDVKRRIEKYCGNESCKAYDKLLDEIAKLESK